MVVGLHIGYVGELLVAVFLSVCAGGKISIHGCRPDKREEGGVKFPGFLEGLCKP